MKDYETLNYSFYPWKHDGTMKEFYDHIHIKRLNKRIVGSLGIKYLDKYNICVDVMFKEGFLDTKFIYHFMKKYKGMLCMVTVMKNNLKVRILANSLGFKKIDSSDNMILYSREL